MGPEDLLVDENGDPTRIDKAFSWEAPISAHGVMHMVLNNAWKGDPYEVDTIFMYMANMSWNSSMNIPDTLRMLTERIMKRVNIKYQGLFTPMHSIQR